MRGWKLAFASAILFMGCGTESDSTNDGTSQSTTAVSLDVKPDGKGGGMANFGPPREALDQKPVPNARPVKGNGINYHGGPVMLGTTNVYYIWYGNWSGNSATTILTDLGAAHRRVALLQHQHDVLQRQQRARQSNAVHYSGSTTDNYSHGTVPERQRHQGGGRRARSRPAPCRRTPTRCISC